MDLPEPSMQAVNGIEESWDVQDVRSANKFWPIIEVAVSGGSFSFEKGSKDTSECQLCPEGTLCISTKINEMISSLSALTFGY